MSQFSLLDKLTGYTEYCMRRLPVCACAATSRRAESPRRDANESADAGGNASAPAAGNASAPAPAPAPAPAGPAESTACCDGVRRQVRGGGRPGAVVMM